jgi:biopolymer transport protein ExbB
LELNLLFPLLAQAPAPASPTSGDSFFDIVFSGGPVGTLIMLALIALSIVAMALVVEHLLTIRRSVLMPPELIEQVTAHLNQGKLAPAVQACNAHPSSLGHILRESLTEAEGGWTAVEKALEDATAEQAARLFRKIEYLSVIGNIGPMLGLLGTVVGMILAFREVANTQGAANAAQLASGIYSALVTTVAGLLIAIPALGAFALFRNRVDEYVAEMAYTAQHLLLPVKRALTGRRGPAVPPPAPSGGNG